MSHRRLPEDYPEKCFPRVSGDEPHTGAAGGRHIQFSPRERG